MTRSRCVVTILHPRRRAATTRLVGDVRTASDVRTAAGRRRGAAEAIAFDGTRFRRGIGGRELQRLDAEPVA